MYIFVGCASQAVKNPCYTHTAEMLGNFINVKQHTFVFGGCKTGLMGSIYSQISEKSKNVIAILAEAYKHEANELSAKRIYLCKTINERKTCFTSISDVAVFLPGGFGTIDEIMSAIESKRAKEHNLPILILNINNYFTPLINMLNKAYTEEFTNSKYSKLYSVVNNFDEAVAWLNNIEKLLESNDFSLPLNV